MLFYAGWYSFKRLAASGGNPNSAASRWASSRMVSDISLNSNSKRQEDMNLSTAAKLADLFNIPLSAVRMHEEHLAALRAGKEGV